MAKPRMRTNRIARLVNDEHWQTLRASLGGMWQRQPERCVKQLCGYIEQSKTARYPWHYEAALQRVMNLLTATCFRIPIVAHRCINEFRLEVAAQLAGLNKPSEQLRRTCFCRVCKGVGWDSFGQCAQCKGAGIKWLASNVEEE